MEGRLEREGSRGLSEEGLESQPSLGDGSVRKWVGGAECGAESKTCSQGSPPVRQVAAPQNQRILLITAGLAASQDKGGRF